MSDNNLSETDSNKNKNKNNNNKENEDQGNAEDVSMSRAINTMNMNIDRKEEEEEGGEFEPRDEFDVVHTREFKARYDRLEKDWLEGHRQRNDIPDEEIKKYGDNAYILSYIKDKKDEEKEKEKNGENSKCIAFHPKYTYLYSNYDREFILPKMEKNQLISTKKMFES
eukprot:210648_1